MHKLDIKFHVSRQFISLIILTILSSLSIILGLPLSAIEKFLLFVFVISYGGWILWRHGLMQSRYSIVALSLEKDSWYLYEKNSHKKIPVELCGSTTLTFFVSVLRFKPLNKRFIRSFVLFNDSMSAEMYRRLLVKLRTIKF